eukprot:TRINITY_DN3327_c0_g1_i1.p1 TRINITY_DN3327_c0_g1~~TRINITY_DN3327_c0_g1_i1.p1  ORF type:complete len:509 (+),score=120.71 TRINITY_DN3327_c0_g1_i1:98-1624(+)
MDEAGDELSRQSRLQKIDAELEAWQEALARRRASLAAMDKFLGQLPSAAFAHSSERAPAEAEASSLTLVSSLGGDASSAMAELRPPPLFDAVAGELPAVRPGDLDSAAAGREPPPALPRARACGSDATACGGDWPAGRAIPQRRSRSPMLASATRRRGEEEKEPLASPKARASSGATAGACAGRSSTPPRAALRAVASGAPAPSLSPQPHWRASPPAPPALLLLGSGGAASSACLGQARAVSPQPLATATATAAPPPFLLSGRLLPTTSASRAMPAFGPALSFVSPPAAVSAAAVGGGQHGPSGVPAAGDVAGGHAQQRRVPPSASFASTILQTSPPKEALRALSRDGSFSVWPQQSQRRSLTPQPTLPQQQQQRRASTPQPQPAKAVPPLAGLRPSASPMRGCRPLAPAPAPEEDRPNGSGNVADVATRRTGGPCGSGTGFVDATVVDEEPFEEDEDLVPTALPIGRRRGGPAMGSRRRSRACCGLGLFGLGGGRDAARSRVRSVPC